MDQKRVKSHEKTPQNQLAREKSPYLLQHASNPVSWYPWGDAAFEKARAEDKPIFLSIGYATCHWCHVMEHESFEDQEVAELMNEHFVSIKVDREERPDIDSVYMTVCQMMTGSGGWPLTILMAPDKRPFFAATYIPKGSRLQRVGMMELLPRVADIWRERRQEVLRSGDRVAELLAGTSKSDALAPNEQTLEAVRDNLERRFDPQHGGFARAPKFPTPHTLTFLLRDWKHTGHSASLEMVERTLQAMRRGGIYDHVGFGFHRYSTDPQWLVPHFEKMLYDQALLVIANIEASLATGKEEYAATAREIIEYVHRDLTSPHGAFFSAEDADSEGEEGKFYVWSTEEVRRVLSKEEADLFITAYGLRDEGNYRDEATGRAAGSNIPHLSRPLDQVAPSLDLDTAELERRLSRCRRQLLEARSQRVRPSLDDKILADWNGLMIAALSIAASALDDEELLASAKRAADFVLEEMVVDGRLYHRHREGETAIPGFLDDYAYLTWGLLELYEASFEPDYLSRAVELTEWMLEHFWDSESGGLFLSADDAELVLARQRDAYDGATPSGNSVAATNLVRLARMTGQSELESRAEEIIASFGSDVRRVPDGFTHLLQALRFIKGPSFEVVVTGDKGAVDLQSFLSALRAHYQPHKVVLMRAGDTSSDQTLTSLAPFTRTMETVDGAATAYVCRNHSCELPTNSTTKMLAMLDASPS